LVLEFIVSESQIKTEVFLIAGYGTVWGCWSLPPIRDHL
jgi:hypothetical protein